MAKPWKFKDTANSKQNPIGKRCNNLKCNNYKIYEGCSIGYNFRNCDLYNVHPNSNLILKSK